MAKADKKDKKGVTKKADPVKEKPSAPASSKEILAKAIALAKSTSEKAQADGKMPSSALEDSEGSDSSEEPSPRTKSTHTTAKKTTDSSDDSSDASSSQESSSEENDASQKGKAPARSIPAIEQKKKDGQGDSSDRSSSAESSSEDSDSDEGDKKIPFAPRKTVASKAKETSDSEDDSSESSSSEESSGESDSDEGKDDKPSSPAQIAPAEVIKKRKADGEEAAPPKKAKVANGSASVVTSGEEVRSIFVGRLSWNVDNDWLAQEFAQCGEVESARVQMDRNTGRSRGFGYVHFKTAEAVEKALALNGMEIDGRPVNIDKSNQLDKKTSGEKRAQAFGDTTSPPSAVLYVGNLSFGVNEDTLWETFCEHGDIKSVRVPTDRETGKPKGFAYVEFSEVDAAKTAHGALQGYNLNGRSIRLDFSQPRDSAGGSRGGQGGRGGRGGWGRGFGGDRGRGAGRGGRGGDRGGRGRGRGSRTGGITHFEGRKITFD